MSKKEKIDYNAKVSTYEVNEVDTNDLAVRRRGQRRRVVTLNDLPSLTQQHQRDQANIHKIISRYKQTGLLPQHNNSVLPEGIPHPESLHDAMTTVVKAQQMFDALPVKIREKFKHDPVRLMEFIYDDKNKAEAVELGLIAAPERAEEGTAEPAAAASSASPQASTAPPTGQ